MIFHGITHNFLLGVLKKKPACLTWQGSQIKPAGSTCAAKTCVEP
jgi:hypothetical protein